MKPILLLGPVLPDDQPSERWLVDLRRLTPAEARDADAAAYSAVIVVNDGGARTLHRVLEACGMRERQEDLGIAVLSYLGHPRLALEPNLTLELKDAELRLEYQA